MGNRRQAKLGGVFITMLRYVKRETGPLRALFTMLICATTALFSFATLAGGECSDDFFSDQTCRSFDDTTWQQGQTFFLGESGTTDRDAFSLNGRGLFNGQIWSRTLGRGDRGATDTLGDQRIGTPPIHDFQCSTDFFGNVSCDGIDRLLLDSEGQMSNNASQDRK